MKLLLLLFASLGLAQAQTSGYLCSWMEAFKVGDAVHMPCGGANVLQPTSETITIQWQCWKQTPHNPYSCQTVYAQSNSTLTGSGGCGVWLGGNIPGQGGSCNPYFSWWTQDLEGANGVTGHMATMSVRSYNLYALPGYPISAPWCLSVGTASKSWSCASAYCQ